MTSDGVNSYTWDRANRLLSMGGASYQYDGQGRRVQQTVSSTVTKYLLDIQPGLSVVLSETKGSNVIRNVFSPRGIHAQKDSSDNWQWIAQDGLGNVREVLDNSVGVLESRNYDPYGNPFGATGTSQTGFGFTGELVDGSGLLDLRARRYGAALGVFASLDPFEGIRDRAMSLNGYSWVEGNVPNETDPSGMFFWAFPSSKRDDLYTTDRYTGRNPSDGSCKTKYAHAWIEYWIEQNNGGLWNTQLEFPGRFGISKIDAITFEGLSLQAYPPIHKGGIAAMIYEIEPLSLSFIADGYIQVKENLTLVQGGLLPLVGKMPKQDRWNPSRDGSPFAGNDYNWMGMTWQLATSLSPAHGKDPVRINPTELSGGLLGEINDAYWILMPTAGLVLYYSECELKEKIKELTEDTILRWFITRYMKAREEHPDANLPMPDFPTDPLPQPIAASDLLKWALILGGGLCLTALAPEVTVPLGGSGALCKLVGSC